MTSPTWRALGQVVLVYFAVGGAAVTAQDTQPAPRLSCINLQRGPYFQAFDGSVALPVAGYNYNSVWTPLLAGLDCLAGVRGLEVRRETGKE